MKLFLHLQTSQKLLVVPFFVAKVDHGSFNKSALFPKRLNFIFFLFFKKRKKIKNALLIFYSISWASCISCLCLNRYVGLDDLQRWLPTLTILWFHELLLINGLKFLYASLLLGRVFFVCFFIFFILFRHTQRSLKCSTCNQKFSIKSVVTVEVTVISLKIFHPYSIL